MDIKRAIQFVRTLDEMGQVGYSRTAFTAELVNRFVTNVAVTFDDTCLALSVVRLSDEKRLEVEVLKKFAYVTLINSSMLQVAEYRGQDKIEEIFDALVKSEGRLMLEDVQGLYDQADSQSTKMRTICDFVAGMTDRYAQEFFGRLRSENPETMFKPL